MVCLDVWLSGLSQGVDHGLGPPLLFSEHGVGQFIRHAGKWLDDLCVYGGFCLI